MKSVSILVDFNNLIFRWFFIKDIGGNTPSPDYNLWRYSIIEDIFRLMRKVKNVREVVIAVDDKSSWRKSYFSRYKESRKIKRDKSTVEWDVLFDQISKLVSDLKHYFPFKVIKVPHAEADDIIGVIAQDNGKDCIVSSNDEDYKQLCSNRVKVWNPSKKIYLECDRPDLFIVEKCLMGQSKDDIFNIKTPDDWGLTESTKGKRKPGFGIKSVEKVMDGDYKQWLIDNDYEDRFHRNQVLMDFKFIPQTLRSRIFNIYKSYNFPPPENIYKYFQENNMRGFIEDIHNIENMLMELY